ncbi:TPA: helix-turn-helix transcriptional regulator [Morganella morganii]
MDNINDDSLIDMKFMTRDAGFTSKYFYSQINKGNLPKPIKIGERSRWKMGDYRQWKNSFSCR